MTIRIETGDAARAKGRADRRQKLDDLIDELEQAALDFEAAADRCGDDEHDAAVDLAVAATTLVELWRQE